MGGSQSRYDSRLVEKEHRVTTKRDGLALRIIQLSMFKTGRLKLSGVYEYASASYVSYNIGTLVRARVFAMIKRRYGGTRQVPEIYQTSIKCFCVVL